MVARPQRTRHELTRRPIRRGGEGRQRKGRPETQQLTFQSTAITTNHRQPFLFTFLFLLTSFSIDQAAAEDIDVLKNRYNQVHGEGVNNRRFSTGKSKVRSRRMLVWCKHVSQDIRGADLPGTLCIFVDLTQIFRVQMAMRRYCINTLVPGCGLAPSAACHWNATAKVEHAHTHMLSHTHTHKHTYANKLPLSPKKNKYTCRVCDTLCHSWGPKHSWLYLLRGVAVQS